MKQPKHIAVIMDGNGRWATAQGLSRSAGHREGTETIDRLLDHLLKLKIGHVSLYAFSTENWRRPKAEISEIFNLLNEFIVKKLDKMIANGVRIVTSGNLAKLPKKSRELLADAMQRTAKGKKLIANFCLNYGARDELQRAAALWASTSSARAGKPPTEKQFKKLLWQPDLPDIDLLVRTAGEQRLSNFMLYQAAYAELYFTDKTWPDFSATDVDAAIAEFSRRKRKFGGL